MKRCQGVERRFPVASGGLVPSDVIDDQAKVLQDLPDGIAVPELLEDGQAILEVSLCFLVVAIGDMDTSQVGKGQSFAVAIADFACDRKALLKKHGGLREALLLKADTAQVTERPPFPPAVADLLEGGQALP